MQSIHPRLATGSRVTTASGIVEGIADQDAGIHSFRGIPFAAPPVGDLRWRPPQPAASWAGVRLSLIHI